MSIYTSLAFPSYHLTQTTSFHQRHVRISLESNKCCVLARFPSLIEQVVRGPLGGAGVQLQINLYNTTWLFVAVCVAYASGSSLLGTVARLPLISGAADQRVP